MTNDSNTPQQVLDARVKQKLDAVGTMPTEFEPDEAQRAGAFVEDALPYEATDMPTFVADGQMLDVPLHITRSNARELFGKQPDESVSDALEPAFIDDEGPSDDIPPFITTTNARELFGLRPGETVAQAAARKASEG